MIAVPMSINRLTGTDLRRKDPGLYGDGNNLYLQISVSRTDSKQVNRSWIFRYSTSGKAIDMGLGSLNVIGLKEAREVAREYCQLRLKGIDPKRHRDSQRATTAAASLKSITFEAAAHAYIAAHRDEWRSEQHAQEWPRSLSKHVFPTLGALPVASIDTPLVVKALEAVWQSAPETGARLRGRIENILDWATVAGYRTGDNPSRWNGHLEYLLSAPRKRQVEHHAAMPWQQVPAFMQTLRALDSVAARALEFLILTAARTGEVRGATWDEIDGDVWIIPGNRMKGGKEHRVPLSSRCLELLKGPRDSERIFPVGENAFPRLLKSLHVETTTHGLRSSFRDWSGEATAFPREICEAALAHSVGNAVEQAYRRGDALERRRKLMQAWDAFCSKPTAAGTVHPIRKRG
jgi:integrase